MRALFAASAALILGLFLGGLPARRELESVRAELERAEKAANRGTSMLPLALGMESLAAARRQANRDDHETEGRAAEAMPRFLKVPEPQPGGTDGVADAGPAGSSSPVETFTTAKTAMAFRAVLAKAAFVDKAHLGSEAVAHLDAAIETMNRELGEVAARAADALRGPRDKLRPRKMVDLSVDVLDVYRRADDALSASFDPATKAVAEESGFDLLSQVDLGAFERLRDITRDRAQDKAAHGP